MSTANEKGRNMISHICTLAQNDSDMFSFASTKKFGLCNIYLFIFFEREKCILLFSKH